MFEVESSSILASISCFRGLMLSRLMLTEVNAQRILCADFAPQIHRKLIEQKYYRLPPLLASSRLWVELVASDHEPVGEVLEKFQPFRLDLAGLRRRIFSGVERIHLDFHIKIGMRREQPPAEIGSAISRVVGSSRMGPNDLGARVVR